MDGLPASDDRSEQISFVIFSALSNLCNAFVKINIYVNIEDIEYQFHYITLISFPLWSAEEHQSASQGGEMDLSPL